MVAGDLVNTASRVQAIADAGHRARRRGNPQGLGGGDRLRGRRDARAEGQGRARAAVARRPGRRRCAAAWSDQPSPRGAVRRPRPRAASRQGALPRLRRGGPRRISSRWWASAASASPASRGSSRSTSTGWRRTSGGTAAAASPTVRESRSGRSPRWCACARGSSRTRTPSRASAKLRAAVEHAHPRSERAALRGAAPRASSRSRGARRARPGEPLRRLAAPLRAHVRGASGRFSSSRTSTGPTRAPRLRRVPRRLGAGPPDLHPHAGPPGACRPATDLGCRQAQPSARSSSIRSRPT